MSNSNEEVGTSENYIKQPGTVPVPKHAVNQDQQTAAVAFVRRPKKILSKKILDVLSSEFVLYMFSKRWLN